MILHMRDIIKMEYEYRSAKFYFVNGHLYKYFKSQKEECKKHKIQTIKRKNTLNCNLEYITKKLLLSFRDHSCFYSPYNYSSSSSLEKVAAYQPHSKGQTIQHSRYDSSSIKRAIINFLLKFLTVLNCSMQISYAAIATSTNICNEQPKLHPRSEAPARCNNCYHKCTKRSKKVQSPYNFNFNYKSTELQRNKSVRRLDYDGNILFTKTYIGGVVARKPSASNCEGSYTSSSVSAAGHQLKTIACRLLLTVLLFLPGIPLTNGRHASAYSDDVVVSGYSEVAAAPYFLSPGSRNITASQGQTAYLHCRVASLGDRAQVSWIRKRDLHVLSSGRLVFASDQRFQVIHSDDKSENWTLQIKFAQLRDTGVYECQVNTVPKIFMAYQLNVVESEAAIQGPEYVKAGSTINLTCFINQPDMQGLVFWYHNREMLKYEDEGRVNILTKIDHRGQITSQLTIRGAQLTHSGNYTCWPTLAKPNTVVVNVVLQGEQPAAMQTGPSAAPRAYAAVVFLSLVCAWLLLTCSQGSSFEPNYLSVGNRILTKR